MPIPPLVGSFSLAEISSREHKAKFVASEALELSVSEPSDVVTLPDGRLLVVSDTGHKVEIISANGDSHVIHLEGLRKGKDKPSGLEAACFDPEEGRLYVCQEETNQLFRYNVGIDLSALAGHTLALDKERLVDLPGGLGNKGVEGMAFLPAAHSPTGRSQILIAKEGDPVSLWMLSKGGKGPIQSIELDPKLKRQLTDFSGLCVHPTTGRIFVCSDESAAVCEFKLELKNGTLRADIIGIAKLRDEHGDPLQRVEGITFDHEGKLCIVIENAAELLRMELE